MMPQWILGNVALNCTVRDFVFSGNVLDNTSLAISGIQNFAVTGNIFHFSPASSNAGAIDIGQSGGPVVNNFTITGNAIEVDSGAAHPTIGINFSAGVASPGSCTVANNTITSNIATRNRVLWQTGSAGANACSPETS